MWSDTGDKNTWLSAKPGADSEAVPDDISPEAVRRSIAKGHYLRACYFHHLGQGFWAAVLRIAKRGGGAVDAKEAVAQVIQDIRNPLTSIRSFSEILRNNPELSSVQRAHYLDIISTETQRLELVVSNHEARSG